MNTEKEKALNLLKTARGQIDGILKMMADDRYCMDISNQIMAVNGLLKKANINILKQHMNYCMKEAFIQGSGEEKVEEIISILDKVIK